MRFSWDKRKAAQNLKKHGVSFEEAESAFEDELAAYYPDTLHAHRFILIGYSRTTKTTDPLDHEVDFERFGPSVRLPASIWKEVEKKARSKHLNLHQAMRAALLGWLRRAG